MIPRPRAGLNPFLLSANGQTGNRRTQRAGRVMIAGNSKAT
nr:MAG TPA: hypothetical protein [Caudoviricetes sp.]